MNRQNFDKNLALRKFIVLYAASILLLCGIFAWLWMQREPASAPLAIGSAATGENNAYKEALKADSLLHRQTQKLQFLDEEYELQLASGLKEEDLMPLETNMKETAMKLKNTIDSLDRVGRADWMMATYLNYLSSRERIPAPDPTNPTDVNEAIINLRKELAAKQSKINQDQERMTALEMDMARLEDEKENTPAPSSNPNDKKITDALTYRNNQLKSENEKISAELSSLRSDFSLQKQTLQNNINDLNAALRFAKVDCNLSRADAEKIISNSRQRMDLLSESADILKALSASQNKDVQVKAREKMLELNNIAKTLRD